MSKREQVALRDRREPGHLWADNEIFDVFGDALGPNGIVVYMVLARYAYGTTVKLSLRELATYARVGKDTVSRSLKVMLELGLIVEAEAGKAKAAKQFSLTNVKKLAVGYQAAKEEIVDHSGRRNCLPVRQMEPVAVSPVATDLSQKQGGFATDLSHTAGPCYRQDFKTQDTRQDPPTPLGGVQNGSDGDDSPELVRSIAEASLKRVSAGEHAAWDGVIKGLRQGLYADSRIPGRGKPAHLRDGWKDFQRCFGDMVLVRMDLANGGNPRLVVQAGDAKAAAFGLKTYSRRVGKLVQEYFGRVMVVSLVDELRSSVRDG